MAETKQPAFRFNYKDVLGLVGLGLLGWAIHRSSGLTPLIFFGSFVCLAWSGLLHVVVKYVEFHVVNSLRLIIHKMDNVPTAPLEK